MNYVLVGVNHTTAPIAVREKFSLPRERIVEILPRLKSDGFVRESAVLSTCNRMEIYGVCANKADAEQALSEFFLRLISAGDVSSCLYVKTDQEAVAHLFQVAASLDSLVVGENQIAKQVKEAYQLAVEVSATGPYLNRLFTRALFVAKRIRTETGIAKGNVSVGSVGVTLAKKIFGNLAGRTVVLFGAGEIGELVLRHLSEAADGAKTHVVNRSLEKAQALEAQGLGKAHPMDDLEGLLGEADILLTSVTGASERLTASAFEALMHRRRNRPLFVIDLGLPRNVDQQAAELSNLYLYNIDDLKTVADETRESRRSEISAAKNIIDEETRLFYESHLDRKTVPMIAGLNRKFDEIRRREMDRTLARLPHLSPADRDALEAMTRAIVARILHDPILHLKGKEGENSLVAGVLSKIFRLNDEGDDE